VIRVVVEGWRRFWDLSWWWKGLTLGGAALVVVLTGVVVIGGDAGGSDDVDTAVLEGTQEPTAQTPDASGPTPSPSVGAEAQGGTAGRVVRVIDGETIEVSEGTETVTVRYIGIAGLATVDPREAAHCFGAEASARNKELVEGKRVDLEKDVTESDSRGRRLRYVYVDGEMVNETLVREGYALAYPIPPDVAYANQFAALEAEARAGQRGLWTACPEARELVP
jgi:micrococcal nuclease